MVKQLKDNLNLQLHRRRKDLFVILFDKQPLSSVAVYKKLVYVGQAHRQVFLGGGCDPTRRWTKRLPEVQASRGVGWLALLKITLSETEFHKF